MNLLIYSTCFWVGPEEAKAKGEKLRVWRDHVEKRLGPARFFLPLGVDCPAELNPLPEATVVQPGVEYTRIYDVHNWSYYACAISAMFWRAILVEDGWDLLVGIEDDTRLSPNLDWRFLLREFLRRPELILAPAWLGRPECGCMVLKRDGVAQWCHNRRRPNLTEDPERVMLVEDELRDIFKGRWWNPWPGIATIRQEYNSRVASQPVLPDEEAKKWPIVALPSPEVLKVFVP